MAEDDVIVLNSGNMVRYGFARYHYPGDEDLVNGVWTREVELTRDRSPEKNLVRVAVRKCDLIPMSRDPESRITSWKNFSISSAGHEVAPMKLLSERAGWNQTESDLRALVRLSPDSNFLAGLCTEEDDIPLGTGAVFPLGAKLGWIGMILVHPELRRQGVASAIMERCVTHARLTAGIQVLGLDATPLGIGLYRALGFRESFRIWRCTLSTRDTVAGITSRQVKEFDKNSGWLENAGDRGMSGKLQILTLLAGLHPKGSFVYIADGKALGFVMSRPGRLLPLVGPLVADSLEVARAMLAHVLRYWKGRGFSEVFLDTPERHFQTYRSHRQSRQESFPWHHRLARSLNPVREFARMYQLISDQDRESLPEKNTKPGMGREAYTRWNQAMTQASASYQESLAYSEMEREQILPYLYASGGPEIG